MPKHVSGTCNKPHVAVTWESVAMKEETSKVNDGVEYDLYG